MGVGGDTLTRPTHMGWGRMARFAVGAKWGQACALVSGEVQRRLDHATIPRGLPSALGHIDQAQGSPT